MDIYWILRSLLLLAILDLGSGNPNKTRDHLNEPADNGCVEYVNGDSSSNDAINIPTMTWSQTPSIVSLGAVCTGEEPLGLESGAITDQQITVSTEWNKDHGPANARFNVIGDGIRSGSWCAKNNDGNQWMQVDFGRDVKITKVATQGRQDVDQWVKSYTLSYSQDGGSNYYTYEENDAEKVFSGNIDRNTVVSHQLTNPITARYLRINPKTWHGHISMRAELYGCVLSERYQVLGRVLHMDFIREHLAAKKRVNLENSQDQPNRIDLELLADTVYVKGNIKLHGINSMTVFARQIVSAAGSQLDLSAPSLTQPSKRMTPGADGNGGRSGVNGPTVEIFARLSVGSLKIITSGGNGNQGQNGADGKNGVSSSTTKPDRTGTDCKNGEKWGSRGVSGCTSPIAGRRGDAGKHGSNGGYAGKPGSGGHAGHQTLYVRKVRGSLELKTCRGAGAEPARNGKGGVGGAGGRGGRGIRCRLKYSFGGMLSLWVSKSCVSDGYTGASHGAAGSNGIAGKTPNTPGSDGEVESSFLQKMTLSRRSKDKYPLVLLKLMKRYAEDLIWGNKIKEGKGVFKFIVTLAKNREDAPDILRVAKRRLGFLNKAGYDRFGHNKLFAPRLKWEALKEEVETIRGHAEAYENAYNDVQRSIDGQEGIRSIQQALPKAATLQIRAERKRLEEAREISQSEKRAYVLAIEKLEGDMDSALEHIVAMFPEVYENAKFNLQDAFVILQGITGFLSNVAGKDPFGAIGDVVGVAEHFATKCNLGSLQENLNKIKKWLTFGKEYAALEDSSDLDFDKMDVGSVPEVMQANLEMNKEALTADLVCMLEERLRPIHKAKFEEQVERFFIAGASRIDLIAKVIDLDNDIGGYNFDIPLLEDTASEIESLGSSEDAPIAKNIRQMFLDNLLTSYQQMETSFTKHLYSFYKGFEFRTLWNIGDAMTKYHRKASSAAEGNRRLRGVLELTEALKEIDNVESKARKCFTKHIYTTNKHKWSFDNVKDGALFEDLHKGQTRFSLKVSKSCKSCYNVRLLKMYVELHGDQSQSGDFPSSVFLELRHMSGSYFRNGNGQVKEYRQPLGARRKFKFDRFAITDTAKCREERAKGNKDSLFCMRNDDDRWQPMCCHYLSDSACSDKLLGAEECKSPFGTYELSLPIDDQASCDPSTGGITDKNCKDFDRTIFTKMNVWIYYLYWSGSYPTGPDDSRCTGPLLTADHKPKDLY